ncbi:hypothetical protein RCL1_001649 [Eukaryota sp. TZLM3-RCL]
MTTRRPDQQHYDLPNVVPQSEGAPIAFVPVRSLPYASAASNSENCSPKKQKSCSCCVCFSVTLNLILLSAIVLAIALFGFTTSQITGRVFDSETMQPISYASVLFSGNMLHFTVSTNETGHYESKNLTLYRSYFMTITAEGYHTLQESTFPDLFISGKEFYLQRKSSDDVIVSGSRLSGRVIDEISNDLISTATVTLNNDQLWFQSSTVEGVFVFHNVPHGIYSLSVQKDGYVTIVEDVVISDVFVDKDIVLTPHGILLHIIDDDSEALTEATVRFEMRWSSSHSLHSVFSFSVTGTHLLRIIPSGSYYLLNQDTEQSVSTGILNQTSGVVYFLISRSSFGQLSLICIHNRADENLCPPIY